MRYNKNLIIEEDDDDIEFTNDNKHIPKKRILIVNLSTHTFSASNKFCGSDNEINYELIYMEGFIIDLEYYSDILDPKFYTDIDSIILYCDIQYLHSAKKFADFLISNNLNGKCQVYYDAGSIVDRSEISRYLTTVFEDKFKIRTLFNPQYAEYLRDQTSINILSNEYLPELNCNEWFRYAINRIGGCMQGRLMQFTGTCYLNAVVNGFILGDRIRTLIFTKLTTLNEVELNYIKSDPMICYNEPKNELYFLQLFYNALCKNTIRGQGDIISQYSKLYDGDNGGEPSHTLKKILLWLFGESNEIYYYSDTSYQADSFSQERSTMHVKFLKGNTHSIPKIVKHSNGTQYELEFAIVTITFHDEDGEFSKWYNAKVESHAVCGVMCNGNYTIYDSNNKIFNMDWTNLTDESISPLFDIYGKMISYTVNCALYIRSDITPTGDLTQLCQMI